MVGKAYEIGLLVSRLNGYLAGDEAALEGVEITPGFRDAHTTSFDFGGYVFARHPAEWARRMETLGAKRARWHATPGADGIASPDSWGIQIDLVSRSLVWRPREDKHSSCRAVRWTPRILDPLGLNNGPTLTESAQAWKTVCTDLLAECDTAAFPEFLVRYESARLLLDHPNPEPLDGSSIFPGGHYSLSARQLFYSVEAGWAPHADWWVEWMEDIDSVSDRMEDLSKRVLQAQSAAVVAAINSFTPSRTLALSG